jgi:hypothetical protein
VGELGEGVQVQSAECRMLVVLVRVGGEEEVSVQSSPVVHSLVLISFLWPITPASPTCFHGPGARWGDGLYFCSLSSVLFSSLSSLSFSSSSSLSSSLSPISLHEALSPSPFSHLPPLSRNIDQGLSPI